MQLNKPVLLTIVVLFTLFACNTIKTTVSNGFTPIFDGKTLNGWEGDPKYWRVENGEIIGEITPATIIKVNTFLIYTKQQPGDFILKAEYRISAKGNSGINYRSTRVDTLPYALKGYQADLDGKDKYNLGYPRYSGQNYEERGRQFLAPRGQRTLIETGKAPRLLDSLGTKAELLSHIKFDDWNELMIVVKGNNMKHYINGTLMSEVTDNDIPNRKMSGLIGVQVHVGPPMKIEYRNVVIRKL
jgi:hypothetical protein